MTTVTLIKLAQAKITVATDEDGDIKKSWSLECPLMLFLLPAVRLCLEKYYLLIFSSPALFL